jgi:hypothetical protein
MAAAEQIRPGTAKVAIKQKRLRAAKAAAEQIHLVAAQDAVKQTLLDPAQTFVEQICPGAGKARSGQNILLYTVKISPNSSWWGSTVCCRTDSSRGSIGCCRTHS